MDDNYFFKNDSFDNYNNYINNSTLYNKYSFDNINSFILNKVNSTNNIDCSKNNFNNIINEENNNILSANNSYSDDSNFTKTFSTQKTYKNNNYKRNFIIKKLIFKLRNILLSRKINLKNDIIEEMVKYFITVDKISLKKRLYDSLNVLESCEFITKSKYENKTMYKLNDNNFLKGINNNLKIINVITKKEQEITSIEQSIFTLKEKNNNMNNILKNVKLLIDLNKKKSNVLIKKYKNNKLIEAECSNNKIYFPFFMVTNFDDYTVTDYNNKIEIGLSKYYQIRDGIDLL